MVTFSGQFYIKHQSVIKVINSTGYLADNITVYYLKRQKFETRMTSTMVPKSIK